MMSELPERTSRLGRLLAYLECDLDNLALRMDAIREACNAGRWGTARTLVENGLAAHPQNGGLLALQGFTELQAQRYVEAERALEAAIERGMTAPEVRFNLAFSRFMLGRYAQVLELLSAELLQQLAPTALLLRARCLHHLDRPLEAIIECKVYLALAPDDADAKGLLSLLLYERRRTDQACAFSEAALQQDALQLEALLTRASLLTDERDFETAAGTYLRLLDAHPSCGRAWLGLALLELMRMRMDSAKGYIDRAATMMPTHLGTLHVLAWIEIVGGNLAQARAAFDRALSIDRTFAETHGGLAVIAVMEGRAADAADTIKRALRLQPTCLSARYAGVLLLEKTGAVRAAQAAFDELLSTPISADEGPYRDFVAAHLRSLRSDRGISAMLATRH